MTKSFAWVAAAVVAATAITAGAAFLHARRPAAELDQPSPELVRAAGKCAQCHREQTAAIVEEYERSAHAAAEINCLECHAPREGQASFEHRGFTLTEQITPKNCAVCHREQYDQFLRSRHAAPAWAAVRGGDAFSAEQIEQAERFHPGAVDRPANQLAQLEGEAATRAGCSGCHSVGQPHDDGSIGDCTDCHSRHWASRALAREPRTCGQCHLGPDHSQLEIYRESKHGVLFHAQRDQMNLGAPADALTTRDMPVPTCATCHMSGLGALGSSHDPSPRLSFYLFAPISKPRPNHDRNEVRMKQLCQQCHTSGHTEHFYDEAEAVLHDTNAMVLEAETLLEGLRRDGLLTPQPYDEPAELAYFDLWHYYGRTAKHGAYMGGADYVQWHGFYPLHSKLIKLRKLDEELRAKHPSGRQEERAP